MFGQLYPGFLQSGRTVNIGELEYVAYVDKARRVSFDASVLFRQNLNALLTAQMYYSFNGPEPAR